MASLNPLGRRKLDPFPTDFMSRLTLEEQATLMLQIATSKTIGGGRRSTLEQPGVEHPALTDYVLDV